MQKLLTPQEISDRLKKFNETRDWSVFNDVPPMQHYAVLYPYEMKTFYIKPDSND
jgi:hypothetical protein